MKNKEQISSTAPASYRSLEEELRIFVIQSYVLTAQVIKSGEDI